MTELSSSVSTAPAATSRPLRIIYMGTPEFAVAPLHSLLQAGHNIVGVVTMPDKPVGRHQERLTPSDVKRYALEQGLRVLQPEKLRDEAFLRELRALKADLQIVVAFRMLPEAVWAMPPLGTVNLHAALLPQYRGAAPINWAIIHGDAETGLTTFFIDKDIDTGRIIEQVRVPIAETDCAGDVHDRLMARGAELIVHTVGLIAAGKARAVPQEQFLTSAPLLPAPKIFKADCRIAWRRGVKHCYDFIRGLSPYPAAWTHLVVGDKTQVLKIYASEKCFVRPTEPLGTLVSDGVGDLRVALADGYLVLKELQLAGKRRMPAADFLRGFHGFDAAPRVE